MIAVQQLRAWVRLGRPKFLLYSALVYALGALLAVYEGHPLAPLAYLRGQLFVWCAHAMTHYCNEFFDLEADHQNVAPTAWTGGSRVLVEGLLAPLTSLGTAFVLLFAALALALTMGDPTAQWLCFGVLCVAWFYTAPPLRLNYRGLGELSVASVLHCLCPSLAFQLLACRLDRLLVLALLPTFLLQIVRMMVMNLCDLEGDRRANKRTLPLLVGEQRALWLHALGHGVAYGSLPLLVRLGLPTLAAVSIAATAPLSLWQGVRLARGDHRSRLRAGSVAFWASTHVALALVGTSLGVILAGLYGPTSTGHALRGLALVPLAYLGVLVVQITAARRTAALA